MASILTFERVGKNINDKNLLANLSFGLQENEIVSITGKENSGKSMIFKILLGIHEKDKGKIFVEGMDYDVYKNDIFDLFGYLPQENIFDFHQNVYNNLYYFSRLRNLDNKSSKDNILKWSNLFDINKELHKNFNDLSFFAKRKIAFIRLLLTNPKILLLDNPTFGMSKNNKEKMWSIINKLKLNKTILFISEDIREIESYSDRLLVLDNGNIKLNSSIFDLKDNFKGNYNYEFLFKRIVPNDFVRKIKNNDSVINYKVREDKIILTIKEKQIFFQILKLVLDYEIINITFDESKLNQIINRVYKGE